MNTSEARKTFEKALQDVSRIRFFEYKHRGMFDEETITLKPKAVEMCHKRNCNAGDNCIHLIKKRGISFCVY